MSGAGATYQSLISPRSRAPIVFSDDDEHDHHRRQRTNDYETAAGRLLLSPRELIIAGSVDEPSSTLSLGRRLDRLRKPDEVQGRPRPRSSIGFSSRRNSVGISFEEEGSGGDPYFYSDSTYHHQSAHGGRDYYRRSIGDVTAIEEVGLPSSSTAAPGEHLFLENQLPYQHFANSDSKSLALPPPLYSSHTIPPSSILRATRASALAMDSPAGDLMTGLSATQQRLEDEASTYRRRLESYRQAQHQQALLVARLQSKLLQYKQRCGDLENKLVHSSQAREDLRFGSPVLRETLPDFRGAPGAGGGGVLGSGGGAGTFAPLAAVDLDDAMWKLEQERLRNDNLMQLNRDLRNELDETRKLNGALSSDLQKLSDDWEKLTKQMCDRENLWKAEEQAYSDYYAAEHSKLLALWKKVAATKRDFMELKSASERDMAQLKNSLARISNQITAGVLSTTVSTPSPQQEAEQAAFVSQLTHEITMAQNTQENLRKQIKDRDDRISALEATVATLDSKSQALEQDLSRISTQELGLLQNCLREIGKLLLSDFDQHGIEEGHELHLTSSPAIFVYDDSGESPTVFAESIVSAVQAALNKRQLQIHSMQVSLASSKEQFMVTRGHVEALEQDLSKAEEKTAQLSATVERQKDEMDNVRLERDTAQRALDNLKNEKNILEQQRRTLASELEGALKLKGNLSTSLQKTEKSLETSRDDVDSLNSELEKIRADYSRIASQLKIEQEMSMKIREQLAIATEDKERNGAENKALKLTLSETTTKYEDLTFQLERSEDSLKKWKMDAEILNEKLRSSIEKSEGVDKEKKKWQEKARQLEEARGQLETDLVDARNDLASLRREMLDLERLKTDLETRLEKETARADAAENRRSILEAQLDSQREEFLREMNLLTERVDALTEELGQTRRELDEAYQILERTKADLKNAEKLHMEAIHVVEAKDAHIKGLTEAIEKIREEKMSMEELEETLKVALVDKDRKIEATEKLLSEIKNKLTAEVGGLKEKLIRADTELRSQKEMAEQEKSALEQKYTKELTTLKTSTESGEEKLKTECEDKIKSIRTELENDKKNEGVKLNNEINTLRQQIDSLRIQYEEALLRAENDKQQGLLLAQQDQQGLSDKIRLLERELEDAKNDKDRLKRECEQKCNHEKNTSASLRSELIKIKSELDNTKLDATDTLKQVEIRLSDIEREREAALLSIEDLRNKLRGAEERESELKRDLAEVNRRLKESQDSGDSSKKEVSELRRTLGEMALEKEKTNSLMENLKDELGRREMDLNQMKKDQHKMTVALKNMERVKAELEGEVQTLSVKFESVERDKMEGGRQLDELMDTLSHYKSVIAKLESEVAELKLKLDAETERRDDSESQWRNTKKLLEDAESQLGITKAEEERLHARLVEVEERTAARENHMVSFTEESKLREKKLIEEKHNLGLVLASVQQQAEQLANKLMSAENRLKNLSDEKSDLERHKKEAEAKLGQITSGMKRLGIISVGSMENPDGARRIMTTLQTQMASMQQDRDSLASQLSSVRDNLVAAEMAKGQLEDQLLTLNRSFQSNRSDNKTKDVAIMNLEKDVTLKNGEVSRLTDKVRELEDLIKSKEDNIRTSKSDKDNLQDELERSRQKLEELKAYSDSKLSKAEVNMRALEGDLNRMALVMQQKDAHVSALEDKCNGMQRNNIDLEERCASLTMTVEQLNIALEKGAQSEQDWKDKFNGVSRNANEGMSQINQLNEKLRSLQREKASLEQDRNNLTEKWEAATVTLQDFKRQVANLSEKNQKLRQEAEDNARQAIDKQLKMTLAESGKEDLRQLLGEKLEFQRRIDSLVDKVRELERENRELERLKDSVSLKSAAGRSPLPQMRDNTIACLEEENSDLRRKINKLEAEIRELERRHTKHIGEVTTQVKQERDFELERARAAKIQAERLLEARESNYRQQIHRLEQQVTHLKEQLSEEIRRRQAFLSRSFRTGQEIRSLRQTLGDSLRNVSMDPSPGTMDSETRRLDTTLDLHKSASQTSLMATSPQMRDPSPGAYRRDLTTPIPKI